MVMIEAGVTTAGTVRKMAGPRSANALVVQLRSRSPEGSRWVNRVALVPPRVMAAKAGLSGNSGRDWFSTAEPAGVTARSSSELSKGRVAPPDRAIPERTVPARILFTANVGL